MNRIINDEIQDQTEIERVLVFLKKYNGLKGTEYQDIEKSAVLNETDIFCYTSDRSSSLTIQLRKCVANTTSVPGNRKKIQLSERVNTARVGDQFLMRIPNNISVIEMEFAKRKKDISGTILLLDDQGTPPAFLLDETKKKIKTSTFKEVWIICRNNTVFKLY